MATTSYGDRFRAFTWEASRAMPSSGAPYFEQDNTLDFIESVAQQRSLVIYVGAGVSIDRTGLQWEHLIDKLMARKVANDKVREQLRSDSPLQTASIVKQLYINEAKDLKAANTQIVRDVHSCLYTEQWRRADIARSVMKLVVALRERNRVCYVVTTNYDDCLQQELRTLNVERGRRREKKLTLKTFVSKAEVAIDRIDDEVARLIGPDRIVHIHGYVPESDTRVPRRVTVSEVDYAKAYPLSSRFLEQLFKDNSVLVLGSSLTDPPLLNALATTANTGGRKRARFAVMPIQGFSLPLDLQKDIRENVASRMKHFDVQVTFPDYYAEVSQFVTEVRIRAGQNGSPGPLRESPKRHGARLRDWWSAWENRRKSDWARANDDDHKLLRSCVDRAKSGLQSQVRDVEIEIWVRWKPDEHGTRLRLWASSKAAWPDVDARTAKVVNRSEYLSVKTFTHGRVEIHPPEARRPRRYLSVPIRSFESRQEELPTAVISFAYQLDNGDDPDKDLVVMDKMQVVRLLTEYGEKIIET
jgi:SIR2-like protein